MDANSVSQLAASASNGAEVTIANKANNQVKAVVGTLLEGIKEAPRLPEQGSGQKLNLAV